MARHDGPKFEQQLSVVDGRNIYTIAGSSADFEWKLTPGSSALGWTDSDYDMLTNVRRSDLTI